MFCLGHCWSQRDGRTKYFQTFNNMSLIFGRMFFFFFFFNPFFKLEMSEQAGGRAGVWRRPRFTFCLTFFFFFLPKLNVTFILQWIAFVFGRDEKDDQ